MNGRAIPMREPMSSYNDNVNFIKPFTNEQVIKTGESIVEMQSLIIDSGTLPSASSCLFSACFTNPLNLTKTYHVYLTQAYISNINCCFTQDVNNTNTPVPRILSINIPELLNGKGDMSNNSFMDGNLNIVNTTPILTSSPSFPFILEDKNAIYYGTIPPKGKLSKLTVQITNEDNDAIFANSIPPYNKKVYLKLLFREATK